MENNINEKHNEKLRIKYKRENIKYLVKKNTQPGYVLTPYEHCVAVNSQNWIEKGYW